MTARRRARVIALGVLSTVAIATLAPLADAETKVVARSGSWVAFGGTTDKGKPVCGVSQTAGDVYFGFKFFDGNETYTIQVGNKAWSIDNGTKLKVAMNFDGNATWNATATGFHFNDGDPGLEFTVNVNERNQFLSEFRNSAQLRMRFPGSMTPDLVLSLNGTGALMDPLLACIRNLR
jgi:hypothetical protein